VVVILACWSGQLQKIVVDLFFPPHCVGCGRGGDFLCSDCCRKLPRILPPFCDRCGKPQIGGTLCPSCWGVQAGIDGIRSIFYFDGIVRKAIHELKYYNLRALSDCIAEFLYTYLQTNKIDGDTILPVPLHRDRLRQRGYNQSALLAVKLGKLAGLPVIEDCLIRIKDSKPQARTKTGEERRKNVTGAFICKSNALRGSRIILVDDVCTTGATLEACAETLKKAGVTSVWGLTVARES
jgi:ComF family protein